MGSRKFTYLREDGFKLSKIDRFLVFFKFVPLKLMSSVISLPIEHFDNSPLILKPLNADFGPHPFRFFNLWLSRDNFDDVFHNAWGFFKGFGVPD